MYRHKHLVWIVVILLLVSASSALAHDDHTNGTGWSTGELLSAIGVSVVTFAVMLVNRQIQMNQREASQAPSPRYTEVVGQNDAREQNEASRHRNTQAHRIVYAEGNRTSTFDGASGRAHNDDDRGRSDNDDR